MANYWAYRIDKNRQAFFKKEMQSGRLRQGWGWDEGQDLRNFTVDEGAWANMAMFNKVKKGDYLLVPELPNWGEVAILQATEDWNKGYKFEIDEELEDYGHIFPVKYIKSFVRHNADVTGDLRSTLKTPMRFWNISYYSVDIQTILNSNLNSTTDIGYKTRFENSITSTFSELFDEKEFKEKVYSKLIQQLNGTEWEYALVYGLQKLFPFYTIERVGGPSEVEHGTDILIKLPSLLPNYEYGIAVQVKDYDNWVSLNVINQINKADSYWESDNLKLIDKIVIITKANKETNKDLVLKDKSVKIIFGEDLKQVLAEIGKLYIGLN
jgi:hypothetical protein